MKDKLITLTVIVLFGLFLVWAVPQVDALAASLGGGHKVIDCAEGYKLEQKPDGGVRITGMCAVVKDESEEPVRPDNYTEIELVGDPVYEYPYPMPDEEIYPEPYDEPESCLIPWLYGQECNP